MRIQTDTTARIIVLALCVCIVVARLLRPDIAMDQYSLGALALAALIAVVPAFGSHGKGDDKPQLKREDVAALRFKVGEAGLELSQSTGAYDALKAMQPASVALAGARATLELRLRALADQARLSVHSPDAHGYLAALSAAGMTTGAQFEALSELVRLLDIGAQSDAPAGRELLETAAGVIEMLDGTIA